ncbi:MAG TPA: hypothetical protein VNI20_10245 [Fimbriimonadaceae bacterium]|nr:hypothetical protein [Fimbriimonadaceae bacterium]
MTSTLLSVLLLAAQATVSVSVDGDGYIRFVRDGRTVYAKSADLVIEDGAISAGKGVTTMPRIQVVGTLDALRVQPDGTVIGVYPTGARTLGKLSLALFPDDVRPVVVDGFLVSSFRPKVAQPTKDGAGKIVTKGDKSVAPAIIVGGGIEIKLKPSAEVDTDQFTVGDIAEVDAPDAATKAKVESLEVSTTPALGVKYMLTTDTLRTRLLRYGKEANDYKMVGPNMITVTRKGQTVTSQQFIDAAIAEARKEYGQDTALSADSTREMIVPLGKVELVRSEIHTSGLKINVKLDVVVDGQKFNSKTVVLDKSDPLSKLHVGQTVKVIVRSNAATVETSGRVKSIDTAAGTVAVTTETGADLVGKATAEGVIEVVL